MSPNADELILQNFCVILPAFNESRFVVPLVQRLREQRLDVLVVDDGSTDGTAEKARESGATVIELRENHGKGEALSVGFDWAGEEGYDAVITMDADGQHDPADVLRFCDIYNRTGIPVLIGNRMGDRKNMPWLRYLTNCFMSWLLRRQMDQYIADTQNGFRLYQADVVQMVTANSKGFAAESEVLLKLDEIGIRMGSVPVKARYGDEKSAIRPIRDSVNFFKILHRYTRRRRPDRGRATRNMRRLSPVELTDTSAGRLSPVELSETSSGRNAE